MSSGQTPRTRNRNQNPQQRAHTNQNNPQAVLVGLNQQQDFITNQINLAVNAMLPQNEPQEMNINPNFALTPALVDTQSLIDYKRTDGKELFKTAIKSDGIKVNQKI